MRKSSLGRLKLALCLLAGMGCSMAMAQEISSEDLQNYGKKVPEILKSAQNSFAAKQLKAVQDKLAAAKDAETRRELSISAANTARSIEALAALKDSPLANAPLVFYSVPAMSEIMRRPEVFPVDGSLGGELRIAAAKDEFEPASFVVQSFEDMPKLEFKISALKTSDGTSFPAENLDLKVVKVWYQNGNGWFSYFSDPGLELVPELLLKDENLIKVDNVEKANYARIDYQAGSKYRWISPPRLIDSRYDEHGWRKFETFRPLAEPFADAATLQPVTLKAGEFKQFWLTANVPKNAKDGLYRGKIELNSSGKKIADIPLALRVLPFELPQAKAADGREFLVTLYSCPSIFGLMDGNGGDRALAEKQLLSMMKDMRQHNLLHPMMNYQRGEMLKRHLELMKEAGLPTRPIIGNTMPFLGHGGAPLGAKELSIAQKDSEAWQKFLMDTLGHTDDFLGSGDEPPASWVAKMRPSWKFYHERGLKIFTAGHEAMFVKGGYVYDMHPVAGYPEEEEKAKTWNTVGHARIGFYAGQHNGSENPAFVRKQHGLLSYLSGFNMVCNYEFALGPWNDRAYDLYKPMVLAYPTSTGLVDTIEWEGFREAIDDIRYATKLKDLANEAIASGKLERVYAGRKVLQWFALLDGQSVDLNFARGEMINKIMQLNGLR